MQVPAFMIIGEKMHERARCLWRGNLLRIENLSPSLAQLSPPSALAKAAEGRVAGKGSRGGRGEEELGEEELAKEDQGRWGAGARPWLTPMNGFQGG